MNKTRIIIIVVAAVGIFAGISFFKDHAYKKEKMILETQLRLYMPQYCPLDYVTIAGTALNIYCTPTLQENSLSLDELRAQIRLIAEKWRSTNPAYAQHTLSVYFPDDVRSGDTKK